MKEFLEKLRQQVAENPPNYGDADSVLGLLYECFNENNPYDSEQIKADFEELYRQMNGLLSFSNRKGMKSEAKRS